MDNNKAEIREYAPQFAVYQGKTLIMETPYIDVAEFVLARVDKFKLVDSVAAENRRLGGK